MAHKDIGTRIHEEVYAKLEGILEEEELSAMIDAAIPRVRDSIKGRVQSQTQAAFDKLLKPFLERYAQTEEFEKHGAEIARGIFHDLANPDEDASRMHHQRAADLSRAVDEVFMQELQEVVRRRIDTWRQNGEMEAMAERVVEKIFPRVAAAWLETGGLRMFNRLLVALGQAGVNVYSSGNCPSCSSHLVTCPRCKGFAQSGSYCCGSLV